MSKPQSYQTYTYNLVCSKIDIEMKAFIFYIFYFILHILFLCLEIIKFIQNILQDIAKIEIAKKLLCLYLSLRVRKLSDQIGYILTLFGIMKNDFSKISKTLNTSQLAYYVQKKHL